MLRFFSKKSLFKASVAKISTMYLHYFITKQKDNGLISDVKLKKIQANTYLPIDLTDKQIHFHLPCQIKQNPGAALIEIKMSENRRVFILHEASIVRMPLEDSPLFELLDEVVLPEDIVDLTVYRFKSTDDTSRLFSVNTQDAFYGGEVFLSPETVENVLQMEINYFQNFLSFRNPVNRINLDFPNVCISGNGYAFSSLMQSHFPSRYVAGNFLQDKIYSVIGKEKPSQNIIYATIDEPVLVIDKNDDLILGTKNLIYCSAIYVTSINEELRGFYHYLPPSSEESLHFWFEEIIQQVTSVTDLRVLIIRNRVHSENSTGSDSIYELSKVGFEQITHCLKKFNINHVTTTFVSSMEFTISSHHEIREINYFRSSLFSSINKLLAQTDRTNRRFDLEEDDSLLGKLFKS